MKPTRNPHLPCAVFVHLWNAMASGTVSMIRECDSVHTLFRWEFQWGGRNYSVEWMMTDMEASSARDIEAYADAIVQEFYKQSRESRLKTLEKP